MFVLNLVVLLPTTWL